MLRARALMLSIVGTPLTKLLIDITMLHPGYRWATHGQTADILQYTTMKPANFAMIGERESK